MSKIRPDQIPLDSATLEQSGGNLQQKAGTTGATTIPVVTTAQRNALTPSAGDIVYNTDVDYHEFYNGASWNALTVSNASGYPSPANETYFAAGAGAKLGDLESFLRYRSVYLNASEAMLWSVSSWAQTGTNVGNSCSYTLSQYSKSDETSLTDGSGFSLSSPFDVYFGVNSLTSLSTLVSGPVGFDLAYTENNMRNGGGAAVALIKLPPVPGTSFEIGHVPGAITNSSNPVNVANVDLAVSNAAHKVLLLSSTDFDHGAVTNSTNFSFLSDATPLITAETYNNATFPMFYLHSPGDTASHNYKLRMDETSGLVSTQATRLFAIEVPSTVDSDQQTSTGSVGPYIRTLTTSANSRIMIMLYAESASTGGRSATTSLKVDVSLDASPIYSTYLNNGLSSDKNTDGFLILSKIIPSAGNHTVDIAFTVAGPITVYDVNFVVVEVPA